MASLQIWSPNFQVCVEAALGGVSMFSSFLLQPPNVNNVSAAIVKIFFILKFVFLSASSRPDVLILKEAWELLNASSPLPDFLILHRNTRAPVFNTHPLLIFKADLCKKPPAPRM
jgi:hypothetical protein